jgi:lactoylglutathione lyase
MKIEHVAIWTDNLERLKNYYIKYFDGKPGVKYSNDKKKFHSYFISFASGARLEIMTIPGIENNLDNEKRQYQKGIIHLAFGMETIQQVDEKAIQLKADGFKILSWPRKTGDGYYEFETLDPDDNRIEVTASFQ